MGLSFRYAQLIHLDLRVNPERCRGSSSRTSRRSRPITGSGLPDAFLDAGALPTLHERYGISRDALAGRIKGWLK